MGAAARGCSPAESRLAAPPASSPPAPLQAKLLRAQLTRVWHNLEAAAASQASSASLGQASGGADALQELVELEAALQRVEAAVVEARGRLAAHQRSLPALAPGAQRQRGDGSLQRRDTV